MSLSECIPLSNMHVCKFRVNLLYSDDLQSAKWPCHKIAKFEFFVFQVIKSNAAPQNYNPSPDRSPSHPGTNDKKLFFLC